MHSSEHVQEVKEDLCPSKQAYWLLKIDQNFHSRVTVYTYFFPFLWSDSWKLELVLLSICLKKHVLKNSEAEVKLFLEELL